MGDVFRAPRGMPRAARRRLARLADEVDRTLEGDRRFFERHPSRHYRLRIASNSEVISMEMAQGPDHPRLWPGWRWYVLIKQVQPGARLRLFVHNLEGEETDIPEAALAVIYDRRTSGKRFEKDGALRRTARGAG